MNDHIDTVDSVPRVLPVHIIRWCGRSHRARLPLMSTFSVIRASAPCQAQILRSVLLVGFHHWRLESDLNTALTYTLTDHQADQTNSNELAEESTPSGFVVCGGSRFIPSVYCQGRLQCLDLDDPTKVAVTALFHGSFLFHVSYFPHVVSSPDCFVVALCDRLGSFFMRQLELSRVGTVSRANKPRKEPQFAGARRHSVHG
ncbi:hypothetical protein DFP73DRAFT_522861 [Morchella snyderi]|nr:hypothetical protein DFP73DRAFT_522861 [Morchella snyderi]